MIEKVVKEADLQSQAEVAGAGTSRFVQAQARREAPGIIGHGAAAGDRLIVVAAWHPLCGVGCRSSLIAATVGGHWLIFEGDPYRG